MASVEAPLVVGEDSPGPTDNVSSLLSAVQNGLSKFGRTADGRSSAFLRLSLDGEDVSDLRNLPALPHVQVGVIVRERKGIMIPRCPRFSACVFPFLARVPVSLVCTGPSGPFVCPLMHF